MNRHPIREIIRPAFAGRPKPKSEAELMALYAKFGGSGLQRKVKQKARKSGSSFTR
jgi:hypothetical protein